jgi:outer membrane protein assembly factor BamB
MSVKQSLRYSLLFGALLFSAGLLTPSVVTAGDASLAKPMDWPHWRGPEMNGISRETGLVDSWDPDGGEGSNLLWKREDMGGRCTPIVLNGKLYMTLRDKEGTAEEGEKVVCLDAATGKTLWENHFNVFLSDVPDTRVGWSSLVGDTKTGNVFSLGVCGYFQCIDGETGKTLWSHSLAEKYGLLSTYGGRTNFPVVHGNLVIVSAIIIGWGDMAKPAHRFIAFDKRNGQPIWFEGTRPLPYDTTYSSAVTAVINGQSMLIFGSGDGGIHAFQPQTGQKIWTYNVSRRGINTTPLVVGNRVFAGHSEENIGDTLMGALFAIDATKTGDVTKVGEVWRNKEWYVGKSSPILIDGKLYAIEDKANLLIVDPKTGKELGRKKLGTVQRSSPLYADGKIYTCTANGRWYILKPDGDSVEVVHKMRLNGEESNGSPIVSHGRIYVPTSAALYCIGKKDQKPAATPRPAAPQEAPVKEDVTPAHVQVVPVESLLSPGQMQQYQVRLYNKNGQFLKLASGAEVKFTTAGQGSVDAGGKYKAPDDATHGAVSITATVGKLKGSARIRVVPKVGWSFDFNDGQIPVTWVGARYRHVPADFDLLTKLKAADPQASQLYIYLTSGFTNFNRKTSTFDNTTPRQTWSALLRYLDLVGKATDLASSKKALDGSLKLLQDEKFVASWEWKDLGSQGVQLIVKKGNRKIDGNGVMMKISTIPKGARSQGWMGHTYFKNYTIQADVYGAERNSKLPDIGLIGQRYRFEIMGASQQLKIGSWVAHEIKFKQVPFAWKSNTWYTMKFQTTSKDGKSTLRGKAWPRGGKEPKDWQIEWTDTPANITGSPGLFGNAKDAEIFYDNVKVTANK